MEEQLHLTEEWDKSFPRNDRMDAIPFDKMEAFFRQYLQ